MTHRALILLVVAAQAASCGKGEPPSQSSKPSKPPQPLKPADVLRGVIVQQGWRLQRVDRLSATQVAALGRKLGGAIREIRNYRYTAGSAKDHVNTLHCADEVAAQAVERSLVRLHRDRHRVARRGALVLEFVSCPPVRRHGIREALGLLDKGLRRYAIAFEVGLLERGDQARVNQAFALMVGSRPGPPKKTPPPRFFALTRDFVFGSTLRLRRVPVDGHAPRYRFDVEVSRTVVPDGVVVTVSKPAARMHKVPSLRVDAQIWTRGWTDLPAPKPPSAALIAATKHWPTGAPAVRAALAAIGAKGSPEKRLEAIHGWVNRTVRYGGPQGSRRGTVTVLAARQGRCWDKADVFVTLARAAGLPARQVAGWVVGLGGHIWAEVWIRGRGWVPVDATAPWLGVPGRYIPLMTTPDGQMPVFHLRRPQIKRLSLTE